MKPLEVKAKITEKFQTIRNFARLSGLDEMYIHNLFKRCAYKITAEKKEELSNIAELCKITEKSLPEGQIKVTERNRLKVNIDLKFKSVHNFCKENPMFTETTVYQVIRGERKQKTPIVKQLFKMFNI